MMRGMLGIVTKSGTDREKLVPSFEEGALRRSSKMPRYLRIGAAREVRHLLHVGSRLTSPAAPISWR
jgi:hypothetical protein